MKQEFQLESRKYNLICSGLWGMFNRLETVLRVSTVKLPGNYGYETCVFSVLRAMMLSRLTQPKMKQ